MSLKNLLSIIQKLTNFQKKQENIEIITEYDIITASGKYPERQYSSELTEEVKNNIKIIKNRVNNLLNELNVKTATVSSGFRPQSVNTKIKNAAKKSLHTQGLAVDLEDVGQFISNKIKNSPELLKKHNLWLENNNYTKTWCHLDASSTRKDREIRIFIP